MDYGKILSLEMGIQEVHANNLIALLDEGCTIPFISRYRKEMHGSLDDQSIRLFSDRLNYLRNLDKRKEEVTKLITDQEKMTPEIQKSIDDANTLTELEDIYRPFRPKRQTRATIAISKGLQPLADKILAQKEKEGDILQIASEYINEEKGVLTSEDALKGACDIIAEVISDSPELRKELREFYQKSAEISSRQFSALRHCQNLARNTECQRLPS